MSARTRQSWAAVSDIGRVRTHNEDAILSQPPLFVVADGLGGHEAGEVASSIAVATLRDHAPRHPDAAALARAVRAANREVIRAAKEGVGRAGMGTTMSAAMVEGTRIVLAQVGDSRAYLLHAGMLEQLTDDHSMVADLIRRGQITEEEARVHPNRSVITRALGTDANMVADTFEYEAEPGDRLLLCSDGLSGMLDDARIAELLGAYRDPNVTAKALVEAANEAGGNDNISVVIVDIEGDAAAGRRDARRGPLAVIAWIAIVVLVAAGIGAGAYAYARSRWFVTAENGAVVVYRGVPGELAGLSLKWEIDRNDMPVEQLPSWEQAKLKRGIPTGSAKEAALIVADLNEMLPPESEPATAAP